MTHGVVNYYSIFPSGYYEGSFGTEHPCKHGWWSIIVEGWVGDLRVAVSGECVSE